MIHQAVSCSDVDPAVVRWCESELSRWLLNSPHTKSAPAAALVDHGVPQLLVRVMQEHGISEVHLPPNPVRFLSLEMRDGVISIDSLIGALERWRKAHLWMYGRLIDAISHVGVPMVVMKGAALRSKAPTYERYCWDFDVFTTDPRATARVCSRLEGDGFRPYELRYRIQDPRESLVRLVRVVEGVHVWIEFNVNRLPAYPGDYNVMSRSPFLEKLIERSVPVDHNGFVRAPLGVDALLIFLLETTTNNGLRLRDALDLSFLLDLSSENFNELDGLVRKLRLGPFWLACLMLMQRVGLKNELISHGLTKKPAWFESRMATGLMPQSNPKVFLYSTWPQSLFLSARAKERAGFLGRFEAPSKAILKTLFRRISGLGSRELMKSRLLHRCFYPRGEREQYLNSWDAGELETLLNRD